MTTLRALPLPARITLAAALAVGLSGLAVSLHLATRHHPGGFLEGLSLKATRIRVCAVPLERAIETTMASQVPSDRDRATLRRWLRSGAPLAGFYEGPGRVLAARCGPCHGAQAGAQGGIRLESYGDAVSLARPGGRDPYRRIARLHVHLFAIGALLALLAWGLVWTRFGGVTKVAVGLLPLGALVVSVPVTLGACQAAWAPPVIWALDGLVVLGWLAGSALLAVDLFASAAGGGPAPLVSYQPGPAQDGIKLLRARAVIGRLLAISR